MNTKYLPATHPLHQFLENQYGIRGTIMELVGYQDRNYLVTASSSERFLLKITVDNSDLEFIRSQNRVLTELSFTTVGKLVPRPIESIPGNTIAEFNPDGHTVYARLFPFLEGLFLAESKPDLSFYFQLGEVFAQLDHEMAGLEDSVLKCRTHEWDLARVPEIIDDIELVADPAVRRLVHYFMMKYREEVLPFYHKLPKCLIHGDGNDWNVLVLDGAPAFAGMTKGAPGEFELGDGVPAFAGMTGKVQVSGIIDFGDMVWGARVNEVAIVLAYAMMGREDFTEVYQAVITGYQRVIELSDLELSVLYYIVAARWCQTMVMAARKNRDHPDSVYHQVSVEGARRMLEKWVRVNPENGVRNIKGVEGVKDVKGVEGVEGVLGVEERYGYFSRAVSLSYREPIRMVGAAMQYMYGADGRTYLDCVNNIPHVGHCHPRVVEAGQRQMARLNTNTRYLYDSLDRYAEKLLSKFPPSLSKVFFVNSGSAATDLAVRLAEAHTGNCDYLVLDYAYHGNTKSAIGLSPYKFHRKGGMGKPENVTILDLTPEAGPHPCPLDHSDVQGPPPNPLLMKEGGAHRQSFFAESIVGCAGQIVLSKELMQQTVREVREAGGIYVADEVQTGFGRVGHKFWAYELYEVVPDMVILGKPMGNGHPVGAVVCTEEIARSFETGMEFFSSFGGNPVSCEIGLAVLEVIEEEGLQENARVVGDFLLNELNTIARRDAYMRPVNQPGQVSDGGTDTFIRPYPVMISEVRGSGLFLGIELVEPLTGNPATEAAVSVVNEMKDRGFLLSTDGPYNNVIKFKPPMCFSLDNAKELVEALREQMEP